MMQAWARNELISRQAPRIGSRKGGCGAEPEEPVEQNHRAGRFLERRGCGLRFAERNVDKLAPLFAR